MIERRLTGFDIKEKKDDFVLIPLVFILENEKYHGFVPGFVMKDIISSNLNECKKMLTNYVKTEVKKMIEENIDFPYFPEDGEIKEDFKNVVDILRKSFIVNNQN